MIKIERTVFEKQHIQINSQNTCFWNIKQQECIGIKIRNNRYLLK